MIRDDLTELAPDSLRQTAKGLGLTLGPRTGADKLRAAIRAERDRRKANAAPAAPVSAPPVMFSAPESPAQPAPAKKAVKAPRKAPGRKVVPAAPLTTDVVDVQEHQADETAGTPCYARPGHECSGEGTHHQEGKPVITVCRTWATGPETRCTWIAIAR